MEKTIVKTIDEMNIETQQTFAEIGALVAGSALNLMMCRGTKKENILETLCLTKALESYLFALFINVLEKNEETFEQIVILIEKAITQVRSIVEDGRVAIKN